MTLKELYDSRLYKGAFEVKKGELKEFVTQYIENENKFQVAAKEKDENGKFILRYLDEIEEGWEPVVPFQTQAEIDIEKEELEDEAASKKDVEHGEKVFNQIRGKLKKSNLSIAQKKAIFTTLKEPMEYALNGLLDVAIDLLQNTTPTQLVTQNLLDKIISKLQAGL